MTDREILLEALDCIKTTCRTHNSCKTCPLRLSDDDTPSCTLQSMPPCEYEIKREEIEWRAFK